MSKQNFQTSLESKKSACPISAKMRIFDRRVTGILQITRQFQCQRPGQTGNDSLPLSSLKLASFCLPSGGFLDKTKSEAQLAIIHTVQQCEGKTKGTKWRHQKGQSRKSLSHEFRQETSCRRPESSSHLPWHEAPKKTIQEPSSNKARTATRLRLPRHMRKEGIISNVRLRIKFIAAIKQRKWRGPKGTFHSFPYLSCLTLLHPSKNQVMTIHTYHHRIIPSKKLALH